MEIALGFSEFRSYIDPAMKYIGYIVTIGSFLYVFSNCRKRWRNRNRIIIRSIKFREKEIEIQVENLSDETDSIGNEIKVEGAEWIPKRRFFKEWIALNSDNELHLSPNIPSSFNFTLTSDQEKQLFFSWYFTIMVYTSKGCLEKIRYKNIQERYNRNSMFYYVEKLIFRFFPRGTIIFSEKIQKKKNKLNSWGLFKFLELMVDGFGLDRKLSLISNCIIIMTLNLWEMVEV